MDIEYNIKVAQGYQKTNSRGVSEFASVEVATFKVTAKNTAEAIDTVMKSEEFKQLKNAYVFAVDVNTPKIFVVGENGVTTEVPHNV